MGIDVRPAAAAAPAPAPPGPVVAATAGTFAVLARGLGKSFGTTVAVAGIDFDVRPGECFGFLGPNGAGKTTTMRMIGGGTSVDSGRLEVLGMDVRRPSRAVKRRLGVVPQEDNLDFELTVRENLLVYGRYFGLPAPTIARRADELLRFVQLADRAGAGVRTLSGGMKRRLLIARSLVGDPALVLLDEPTTGLDPQARHLTWEKLRQLKAAHRTLLLTTHYMEEAEQLCDRLVVMEGGKILAEGSPRDLIRRHVAREVVEVRAPLPVRWELVTRFGGAAAGTEMLEESLLFHVDDGDTLLRALSEHGLSGAELHVRRATLEDVFLKLTGRSLGE